MRLFSTLPGRLVALFWVGSVSAGLAHPVPDIPVRADFAADGTWTLQVEVDPRCFEPDPNVALSVTQADLALLPAEKREKLRVQAQQYVNKVVAIVLDPPVKVEPALDFQFTTHENAPLKAPEDVVVLTGTWKTRVPPGTTGYSIKALPEGNLTVLYHNTALGKKLERWQALFPGESSFVLDLNTFTPRTPPAKIITSSSEVPETPSGSTPSALPAVDQGGICVTCYEADSRQTLPVVGASVAGVLLMLWWKGRRTGKQTGSSPDKPA